MSDETEDAVRADADQACTICKELGWHWGWAMPSREAVRLRCPCVDLRRAEKTDARLTPSPTPIED